MDHSQTRSEQPGARNGGADEVAAENPLRLRHWLGVVSLHLLITYIVTYPAAKHIQTGVFGGPRGDKFQFIWIFWWFKKSLIELGQLPFFTELQYYPTGVTLALHDMTYFWSLLSVPMQWVATPASTLNLFLLISFVLNGLAFYRLASVVTREHWGALAGSLVFAYCPYLVGRFRVAHIQYLGVFFIPLFFLYLWRYHRAPSGRNLVKAGVCIGLQSLISFYYGIAMSFAFLAFVALHCLRSKSRWQSPEFWRSTLLHAAITGGVAAVITLPAVVPGLIELRSGNFEAATARPDHGYLEHSAADLLSYALPDYTVAPWRGWTLSRGLLEIRKQLRRSIHGNPAEKSVYPGWVSWGALLVVVAFPALRRRAWPWIAITLAFFVLTLGPTVYVGGEPHLEGWLPARFMQSIPVVNIIRGPSRFATFVTLGSGMLLAIAIARLRELRGATWSSSVACACMLFTCLEFLPIKTRIFPQKRFLSPFYEEMGAEPDSYRILNVPADFRGARGGGELYQYAQTIHGKTLVSGYVSREPTYVFDTLNGSPFLQAIEHHRYDADRRLRLSEEGLRDMPRTLRELGVRYLIVHRSELAGQWPQVNAWLMKGPVEPSYQDPLIRVYRFRENREFKLRSRDVR
jgi:hypothetical protein